MGKSSDHARTIADLEGTVTNPLPLKWAAIYR